MPYYLYILRSQVRETYYTGVSDSPERRHHFHNHDGKGYTVRFRPWDLVYTRDFESKQEALEAERVVKGWKSRKMIRLLVEGKIDIEDYL